MIEKKKKLEKGKRELETDSDDSDDEEEKISDFFSNILKKKRGNLLKKGVVQDDENYGRKISAPTAPHKRRERSFGFRLNKRKSKFENQKRKRSKSDGGKMKNLISGRNRLKASLDDSSLNRSKQNISKKKLINGFNLSSKSLTLPRKYFPKKKSATNKVRFLPRRRQRRGSLVIGRKFKELSNASDVEKISQLNKTISSLKSEVSSLVKENRSIRHEQKLSKLRIKTLEEESEKKSKKLAKERSKFVKRLREISHNNLSANGKKKILNHNVSKENESNSSGEKLKVFDEKIMFKDEREKMREKYRKLKMKARGDVEKANREKERMRRDFDTILSDFKRQIEKNKKMERDCLEMKKVIEGNKKVIEELLVPLVNDVIL